MLGKKHLHIAGNDQLSKLLVGALHSARSGSITITVGEEPAAKIAMKSSSIDVDLLHPDIFSVKEDETGMLDKLRTASEFAHKLTEGDLTITFLRNGKEALRLGRNAKPTFSKIITRSDDLQLTSIGEFAKLKRDLKTD
jgi:hypothetical protein